MSENLRTLIRNAEEFVRSRLFGCAGGHDWLHTCRVRNLALKIARNYSVNISALELSALFHDVGRTESDKNHAAISAKIAKNFLNNYRLSPEFVEIVIKSIEEHSSIEEPTYFEGKILQDADKLDGMGAIGLMRVAEHGAIKGMLEYDPRNPMGQGFSGDIFAWIDTNLKEVPNKRMRVNEFIVEELLGKEMQWINMLWTKEAKEIAKRRFDFMKSFIYELYLELVESDVL